MIKLMNYLETFLSHFHLFATAHPYKTITISLIMNNSHECNNLNHKSYSLYKNSFKNSNKHKKSYKNSNKKNIGSFKRFFFST